MKSRGAFVLVLIGVILGFISSLWGIATYFIYRNIEDTGIAVLFGASNLVKNVLIFSLIGSIVGVIVGVILSLILIFYLVRIAREPSKTDFVVTMILGGLGIFLGMGLGGIFALIGGIIGVVKSND